MTALLHQGNRPLSMCTVGLCNFLFKASRFINAVPSDPELDRGRFRHLQDPAEYEHDNRDQITLPSPPDVDVRSLRPPLWPFDPLFPPFPEPENDTAQDTEFFLFDSMSEDDDELFFVPVLRANNMSEEHTNGNNDSLAPIVEDTQLLDGPSLGTFNVRSTGNRISSDDTHVENENPCASTQTSRCISAFDGSSPRAKNSLSESNANIGEGPCAVEKPSQGLSLTRQKYQSPISKGDRMGEEHVGGNNDSLAPIAEDVRLSNGLTLDAFNIGSTATQNKRKRTESEAEGSVKRVRRTSAPP